MANRIEGVNERLETCATLEFLANGYGKASLRTIAERAGTTPTSIYTRYGDKDGLYKALVEETAQGLKHLFEGLIYEFEGKPALERKVLFHSEELAREYQGYIEPIIDYIYAHWRECRLLISCSEGSSLSCFLDELVEIDERHTLAHIQAIGGDLHSAGVKSQMVHLLCSSFIHGFFEVVRHDMGREDALDFVGQLGYFFSCGWDKLTPYSYSEMDLLHRLSPPGRTHLLGTDEAGRDILTRLLFGARVSLLTGVIPTILSMVLGALLGVTAGYFGGWVDTVIMRLADIVLAFPSMLLAMVIMYVLGDGLLNIFLTLALVNWASVSRVVRSQALQLRETEFVEAAQVMGVSRVNILLRHVLPNCIPTMIVLFTLNVPSAILTESSLSFLGLGIQPPAASWGLMVNAGRQCIYNAPWVSLFPSLAIMLTVLSFNFLGDGLRDVLDPHLKR